MDRIGPFVLAGNWTDIHAGTLRDLLNVDWPWWTLLTHHRGQLATILHRQFLDSEWDSV